MADNIIGGGQPQTLNIDPADCETVTCICGCKIYVQAAAIKKVSRILTGEQEDRYMQIPLMACKKCGELMPDQINFEL